MKPVVHLRPTWASASAALVASLAGCSAPPPAPLTPALPATVAAAPVQQQPAAPAQLAISGSRNSSAATAHAYRADAAAHLYGLNRDRIYQGKLPPMLYAIGVLQVEVDSRGNVGSLHWLRAPRHAPEVISEIERTVRAAAPFPAPARLGKVVYTDTWLWHHSGRFQLDTLTEGQL